MNQAEKALKALLEPTLREHGFKAQSASLTFKRRTVFGFHELSLPSFAWAAGGPYVVNVGLGVRHNRVDMVVNRLGHIWGESNQKNTTTVYRGLGFFPFEAGRDGEKTILTERMSIDAASVASDISLMLAADGYAFYERYSDLRECSLGLNDPIEARTHALSNRFPMRAYYGVAAAALAQPERVHSLIRSYTEFALRDGIPDDGVYEVGKELTGVDAIATRLEFVAQAALASAT
ncbi:MAG: hypothetical protein EON59_11405 [Alphaproteobacteria bacterium]|nr:MAG: hypothetical protein EON59_11405 [Alphaproteobacteria bacterium]